jgi:hypothetical protein
VTLSAIAPISERDQLERWDHQIEQWIELIRGQAETVDRDQIDRLIRTAKTFAIRINDNVSPSLDPASVAELRGILLGGFRTLEEGRPDRQLDILDDLLVRAESVRHIIRDAIDEEVGCDPNDVQCLTQLIVGSLPRITQAEVADLLDKNPKTIQRWLTGTGRATRRLQLVAKLVNILKLAWTPEGVMAWFDRPREDLDDQRPRDVLDTPEYEHALLISARRGRAQHGS